MSKLSHKNLLQMDFKTKAGRKKVLEEFHECLKEAKKIKSKMCNATKGLDDDKRQLDKIIEDMEYALDWYKAYSDYSEYKDMQEAYFEAKSLA